MFEEANFMQVVMGKIKVCWQALRPLDYFCLVNLTVGLLGMGLSLYGLLITTQTQSPAYFTSSQAEASSGGIESDLGENAANEASLAELSSAAESVNDQLLVVDIGGAVVAPGVYQLPQGSRLNELIIAAGGFKDEADKAYLAHTVNLASLLADGQKVYLPFNAGDGESISQPDQLLSPDTTVGKTGKMSINQASSQELQNLPGIGEKRAEDIIAGRPYQNTQELVNRQIIGVGVFEQIQALIKL